MKRLIRVVLLLLAAAMLVVAGLVIRLQLAPGDPSPQPLPVAANEHEIVWLSAATSGSAWERFVAAVRRTAHRLQADMPDLEAQLKQAYPPHSTDVPEVALAWKNSGQRLVFRWYKLTSRWKTADWIDALLKKPSSRRPPLAIIGGSSSESAWGLARELKSRTDALPQASRPVLLLTTATADRISPRDAFGGEAPDSERIRLSEIYGHRTFRFCFTNNQMAFAVTRFIWSQPELRTDSDPAYLVQWDDDSYSYDLSDSFLHALQVRAAEGAVTDWAWATGWLQAGNPPGALTGIMPRDRFRQTFFPILRTIPSSVGSFAMPNRHEEDVAEEISRELGRHPEQHRPLLVVTGQAQPSRRFLRALQRVDPERTRRVVVATGDAVSFNNIYRDRRTIWPIQDLPMSMVFFCHCNPIDREAGFRPAPEDILPPADVALVSPTDPAAMAPPTGADSAPLTGEQPSSTGTEDILLNADIVETVARTFAHDGQPCANADELIARLGRVRLDGTGIHLDGAGEPFFAPSGNRRSATGEHVVCLQPVIVDGRVLPQARLEVWKWQPVNGTMGWKPCAAPLFVSYKAPAVEGGARR